LVSLCFALDSGSFTLTLQLDQLPPGGTVSDGKHHYSVLTENETIDVTGWNLNTLTFLPPANFNGSFILNIRATESREGHPDAITLVSVKIGTPQDNGNDRPTTGHTGTGSSPIQKETVSETQATTTTASAKTASITVHSVLPDPEAKPQRETETRYHVLNLASSRAPSVSTTTSIIDWTKRAELGEVREMGGMSQFLASAKEKVHSLAEITGLFFPGNQERQP
jgi:hypothetical protein